jgi:hypothetical protein
MRVCAAYAIAPCTQIPFIELDKIIKPMKRNYKNVIEAGGRYTKY